MHWREATSFFGRLRGLLGRPRPGLGEAWWIAPCRAVHTAGMAYPIDVVFVGTMGQILRIVPALPPWRLAWCLRARAVIELAEGEAARLGWKVGDRVGRPG
ncbi:MAG: DUF192 domain-containing protein [Pigmentiphaga sp.]|uniref:DUF192 domain-containing protein n=1 Tax=Pigmentiphaga sp. TaxID=1977564 RepID=UPI0029B6598B|nr:DUF192 domain-containing protein [Pigmentiphaga sp.]MDX3907673.1 DUF192 domain-containing protein [Pigmentiphaga sp.]